MLNFLGSNIISSNRIQIQALCLWSRYYLELCKAILKDGQALGKVGRKLTKGLGRNLLWAAREGWREGLGFPYIENSRSQWGQRFMQQRRKLTLNRGRKPRQVIQSTAQHGKNPRLHLLWNAKPTFKIACETFKDNSDHFCSQRTKLGGQGSCDPREDGCPCTSRFVHRWEVKQYRHGGDAPIHRGMGCFMRSKAGELHQPRPRWEDPGRLCSGISRKIAFSKLIAKRKVKPQRLWDGQN